MGTTLATLAQLVEGRCIGDGQLLIDAAGTLATARPGEITLIDAADKTHRLTRSSASAVVVPKGVAPDGWSAIQVADVHAAFATIVSHFKPQRAHRSPGISPAAFISPTATIGEGAEIHCGVTIGDDVVIGSHCVLHSGAHIMPGCRLGDQVTMFPSSVLYENTIVGSRSIIHAGAIIGSFGFGYKLVNGHHQLSAQLGYVELGADVEVGASSTIDRGTYGATVIGDGTKIDNLVMIAHNCRIGRHNMICSQVGIAGSTTTGDYVVMAGQVGVRDHVHIGDRAVLGAMAGIVNDVPADAHMLGAPAIPEREQKINFAVLAKLPEMRRQLKALQRTVDALSPPEQLPDTHAA